MTNALEFLFQYLHEWRTAALLMSLIGLMVLDGFAGAFIDPTLLRFPFRFVLRAALLSVGVELCRRYVAYVPDLSPAELLTVAVFFVAAVWIYPRFIYFLEGQLIRIRIDFGDFREYSIIAFTSLKTGSSDHGRGVVRLSPDILRDLKIRRNALVAIRGQNGNTIYRIARGTPPPLDEQGHPRQHESYSITVGLELDDRIALDARNQNGSLKLWSTGFWNLPGYMINHTDVLTRINFVLSVALLLVGVITGWALNGFSMRGVWQYFN